MEYTIRHMKLRNNAPWFKRKITWIISGIVAACVVLVVGVWTVASSRNEEIINRVNQHYAESTSTAASLTGRDLNREQRRAALSKLSSQPKLVCEGAWWSKWQQSIIPSAQAAAKKCQTKVRRLTDVERVATRLHSYLAAERKIAEQLKQLAINSKSKNWQKEAAASATEVNQSLKAMSVTEDSKDLLAATQKRTATIVSAWGVFNQASNKKDKDAYLKAKERLEQSYVDLGAISDMSDEQIEKMTKSLYLATSKL